MMLFLKQSDVNECAQRPSDMSEDSSVVDLLSSPGVGKLRPAGQIRPAASFCTARDLRMDFTFSNSLKFQSTRYNETVCGARIASHSHAAWWPLL
jgi:hypothetical protein